MIKNERADKNIMYKFSKKSTTASIQHIFVRQHKLLKNYCTLSWILKRRQSVELKKNIKSVMRALKLLNLIIDIITRFSVFIKAKLTKLLIE